MEPQVFLSLTLCVSPEQRDIGKVNNSHDMSQSSRIYFVLRVTSLACGRVKIQTQMRERAGDDPGNRGAGAGGI